MKIICKIVCLCIVLSFVFGVLPVMATADNAAEDATQGNSEQGEQKVVVIVNKDIARGTRIFANSLELKTVSKDVPIPANACTSLEDVKGMYAVTDLYGGEYVYSQQISSQTTAAADKDLLLKPITDGSEFVTVTDYVKCNTDKDMSYYLQEIIDKNPGATIFFPDGVYILEHPLYTPSQPKKNVTLKLADGAVIKASDKWQGKRSEGIHEALINSGSLTKEVNDINSTGHYFSIMGGTLDGNHKANGINVEGGREALYRNICIKNAIIGIYIGHGVNNTSMDVDFEDITIIGDGRLNTIGLKNIAADNTYTNFRIYNVQTGVENHGGGFLKSLYVINDNEELMASGKTVGIITSGNSWMSGCYTENCSDGYKLGGGTIAFDCFAAWTGGVIKNQIAYKITSGTVTLTCSKAYFQKLDGGEYTFALGKTQQDVVFFDSSFNAAGVNKDVPVLPA